MGDVLSILFVMILVFIGGLMALIFSILAWRLRKNVFFYLGLLFTAIIFIYSAVNYKYILSLFSDNIIFFFVHLIFIVAPVYFLIQSKIKKPSTSFEGIDASGKVSENYLDKIINAPDEEIDFEEDLDLR